jgi:hypothetical protein
MSAGLLLQQLRADLALLPVLKTTFGGADAGVPDTLVRYKVLAVVDDYIVKAQRMAEHHEPR